MKRIIKEIRLLAVKNSAYEIINKKHATYYGMAMSVKRICEVIMRNEKSILPVSHIIHGVYDIDGVSLSMPVIVGVDGIESNMSYKLTFHLFLFCKRIQTKYKASAHCRNGDEYGAFFDAENRVMT